MRPGKYYRLDGHTPVPEYDLAEWARQHETADRQVARTEFGGIKVMTEFIGFDQSFFDDETPQLFETLAFSGHSGKVMDRYATWDEAVAGHDVVVANLKAKGTL